MTVSTAHRKDLVRTMLIQMVDAVGDNERVGHVFRPDDPRFASILGATWREMVDAGLIKDFARSDFVLTPFGWITGLRLSGRLESVRSPQSTKPVQQKLPRRRAARQSRSKVPVALGPRPAPLDLFVLQRGHWIDAGRPFRRQQPATTNMSATIDDASTTGSSNCSWKRSV